MTAVLRVLRSTGLAAIAATCAACVTESTPPPAPPPQPETRVFFYPLRGQSAERQDRDRYECHNWASARSGFDPTLPGSGVPAEETAQNRADSFRADAACLQGRGYTVR